MYYVCATSIWCSTRCRNVLSTKIQSRELSYPTTTTAPCILDPSNIGASSYILVAYDVIRANRSLFLSVDISRDIQGQLGVQQVRQIRSIPEIDPLPICKGPTILLLVHVVSLHDPVVPLGTGDRGAEPDLLVGGLLVQDIGADTGEDDV